MQFINAKSILSSQNGMNIFRGCTHGCIYCDSRSDCYHTPKPFEDIEVKQNAPELLEAALLSKRKKCMIGTGSMTDPYLHAEKDLRLTRHCLEIIDRHGFGLAIQTKSDLILRDLDLLKSINQKSKCVVEITLTTANDELCKKIEPNVCPTSRRIEVLKIFQKEGIPTVVWLSPFLPFINDDKKNFNDLMNACVECGVKGILLFGIGLTLRDGNREYFYKMLDEKFPGAGLKEKYIKTYGASYALNSPNNDFLLKKFYSICKTQKILCTPDEVFAYMREFPEKKIQTEFEF